MKTIVYVALENLRSLYNIGAIYRTCEFFGVSTVILLGYSGIDRREGETEIHKRIQKTSLGTIEKVQTEQYKSITEMKLAHPNAKLIGIENNVPNTKNLYNLNEWTPYNKELIIIFGNEVEGLTTEAQQLSDELVEIPRIGTHSSLNVTTACGIVLGIIRMQNV